MALLVDLYQQYNPVNDWSALAKAVDGSYIKYSDGTGGARMSADAYAAGCSQHGIPYGGYHYAEPGDPLKQADVFVAQYRRLGGALAPALDLETGGIAVADRPGFARAFLERVHASYPVVVLYASTSWLATLNPDTWPYPWDRTWAAEYGTNTGIRNTVRHYGGRVDLHQYTSVGRIPGATGNVDLDWTDNLGALLLNAAPSPGTIHREDISMQIPKSPTVRNVSIAWPGRAGHLVVAPGNSPVLLSAIYNWDNNSIDGGTGGNPVAVAGYNPSIGIKDPRAIDIPAGTLKVDFFYSSGDDFDVLRDV